MHIKLLDSKLQSLFGEEALSRQAEEWGWRVPSGFKEVTRIGLATSLTPEVIASAVRQQAQLIVTHHDPWEFLLDLRQHTLQLLENAAIAHLFVHAPLDAADFGTSASLLKLTGCCEIGKFDFEHPGGCSETSADFFWGRYGKLDTPEPFDVFERKVSRLLGEAPRIALPSRGMVQCVATVTGAGSGMSELKEAAGLGCDTYITGEMSLYFLMYARYQKLNVLVYSHTGTEIIGVEALVRRLVEDNPEVAFTRLDEERL